MAPDKIEIKREVLPVCQIFWQYSYWRYQKIDIKTKNIHQVLELSQSQWLKSYDKFNTHTHKIEVENNRDKHEKTLYKLMDNTVYRKAMKNLNRKINVRLLRNEKFYLK